MSPTCALVSPTVPRSLHTPPPTPSLWHIQSIHDLAAACSNMTTSTCAVPQDIREYCNGVLSGVYASRTAQGAVWLVQAYELTPIRANVRVPAAVRTGKTPF